MAAWNSKASARQAVIIITCSFIPTRYRTRFDVRNLSIGRSNAIEKTVLSLEIGGTCYAVIGKGFLDLVVIVAYKFSISIAI